MKTVTLVRDKEGDLQGQYGSIAVPGVGGAVVALLRDCIELPREHNDPNRSCIAPGRFLTKWTLSPHLSALRSARLGMKVDVWTYELQDVPGRDGIRLHPLNFAGDSTAGWEADAEGCIGPGLKRTPMANKFGVVQNAVQHSAQALEDIVLMINDGDPARHDDFELVIVDDYYEAAAVA